MLTVSELHPVAHAHHKYFLLGIISISCCRAGFTHPAAHVDAVDPSAVNPAHHPQAYPLDAPVAHAVATTYCIQLADSPLGAAHASYAPIPPIQSIVQLVRSQSHCIFMINTHPVNVPTLNVLAAVPAVHDV